MPHLSTTSSGVFGRFTGKRQVQEIQQGNTAEERFSDSPPLTVPIESDKSRLLNGHKRESSILSLPSSVTDLGHNVRRSVSLRSHRTQQTTDSIGHRPRYPSSGNLLNKSPELASPVKQGEPEVKQDGLQQPVPQRPTTRGKLSSASRSLSLRFKSTDTLPLRGVERQDTNGERPPLPTVATEPPKTPFSMLVAAPSIPKRAPPDRPSLAPQASFSRDISSSHGSTNGGPIQPTTSLSTVSSNLGSQNPNAIYQSIHETSAKRMATVDYFRRVHEGNIFYFSTLHYTSSQLNSSIPSLHTYKQGRRATNYLALGYSLPLLLELNSGSPIEYLKALSALVHEFETYQSLSDLSGSGSSLSRARVGAMFKSGMGLGNRSGGMRSGRRSSAATDNIAIDASKANLLNLPHSGSGATSPQDVPSPIGHDFQHLLTPHLPFEPDFNTTFATLCDTLIDTYANLLSLVSNPDLCSPALGEAFAKADKAVRKILVSTIMREFEDGTRSGVKTEVAGLQRLVLGGLM